MIECRCERFQGGRRVVEPGATRIETVRPGLEQPTVVDGQNKADEAVVGGDRRSGRGQ
jgi:hypothetical protein